MAGITEDGFTGKTEEEILDELKAEVTSRISPSLNTTVNGVIGRLLAIIATAEAEDWEVIEATYSSQYEEAEGESLDKVCALTGTTRDKPSYSTVTATVNMDSGTAVTAGQIIASVDGNPNALFENVSAFTAPSTGNHSLEFIAQNTGPVLAPSGTLTVLEVTITGVNSITNSLDADPGANQENDANLRIKRRNELTAQGTGTQSSMIADVSQVQNVESASILVNRTPNISGVLSPHTFEIVVFGGADNDIAQAIWDSMPSGIFNFGSNSGIAIDHKGNNRTVYFTRPTEIRVYVSVTVVTNPDTYAGDTEIKEAISNFTNGSLILNNPDGTTLVGTTEVGVDVVASKLYSAVNSIAGVEQITSLYVGLSASPSSGSVVSITDREIVAVSGVKGIQTVDVSVTSS